MIKMLTSDMGKEEVRLSCGHKPRRSIIMLCNEKKTKRKLRRRKLQGTNGSIVVQKSGENYTDWSRATRRYVADPMSKQHTSVARIDTAGL